MIRVEAEPAVSTPAVNQPVRRPPRHPAGVAVTAPTGWTAGTATRDYVYVPPFAPHREENPDPDEDAVVVVTRTTQQAIVVNLPSLRSTGDDPWHRSS
jgi:hypothetical protein